MILKDPAEKFKVEICLLPLTIISASNVSAMYSEILLL